MTAAGSAVRVGDKAKREFVGQTGVVQDRLGQVCRVRLDRPVKNTREVMFHIDALEELRQRPGDQPQPVVNDLPSIQALVRQDVTDREAVGISRYGTSLQPHNGRDSLLDAYQEALDLATYLRQALFERDGR